MNKNIFKAVLCAALTLPVLTSCELDQEPYSSITYDSSWSTDGDACKR